MDGITAHAMAPELDGLLSGSLVERISMSDKNTLHLALFTAGRTKYNLTLDAIASRPSLILSTDPPPQGLNPPPAFVMLLRKHLRRARITAITTPPWERVFILAFRSVDELGDGVEGRLLFECMPRTANLVLVNREDVILGALRHIDHRVNRVRETLPAHPYLPPPGQNRPGPDQYARQGVDRILEELKALPLTGRALSQQVAGFSPLLGEEALARAGTRPSPQQAADSLRSLCLEIAGGHFSPAVYFDGPQGNPMAVHAVKLTQLPWFAPYDCIYEAVAAYSQAAAAMDRFKRRQHAIARKIEEQIKRTQRKRELHEADVTTGKEAADDRLMGELVLAWIHTIPPGSKGVLLDNYHEQGSQLYCPLNPRLTAAENAKLYFGSARRKERKLESATKLLRNDLDELAWLESLRAAAGYAETEEDLSALEHEYLTREDPGKQPARQRPQADRMPGKPASKKRRKEPTRRPPGKKEKQTGAKEEPLLAPPRLFRSSDGFLITSGRNNLQNDRLLRKAGRGDLWFHAKNSAGSHVILSAGGREFTPSAIEEAAIIAAWYSGSGRAGSAVEVDYCPVRHVKKIPGTRPGNVSYQEYKTLYVRPADPSQLRVSS